MNSFIAFIGVLLVASILEVWCGVAIYERARAGVDRLFIGKGPRRFFGLTALFSVALYAIGIALMAPFIGVFNGAMDVGLLFVVIMFGGLFLCWRTTAFNVGWMIIRSQRRARETSVLFGTVFVTAVWGCAILLIFFDASAATPLSW